MYIYIYIYMYIYIYIYIYIHMYVHSIYMLSVSALSHDTRESSQTVADMLVSPLEHKQTKSFCKCDSKSTTTSDVLISCICVTI